MYVTQDNKCPRLHSFRDNNWILSKLLKNNKHYTVYNG